MYSSVHFLSIISIIASPALADLTCLQWGFVSPLVSAICHFSPTPSNTAMKIANTIENATVSAVKKTASDLKDLIEFDIQHHPFAIAYNIGKIASNNGWAKAADYYVNTTVVDNAEVTVGFVEESVNQAYALYNLWEWNDLANCVIWDAAKAAVGNGKGGKLRRRWGGLKKRKLSDVDAVGIVKGCVSEKFSKGPVFNITGANQKIGATISDFATLFIPIGPEGAAVEAGAKGAVDLAIAGAEDATRIYKQSEVAIGRAEHFADAEEASRVAESLKEEGWQAKNCGTCSLTGTVETTASSVGFRTGAIAAAAAGAARRDLLQPRGNVFGLCCKPRAPETQRWKTLEDFEAEEAELLQAQNDLRMLDTSDIEIENTHFADAYLPHKAMEDVSLDPDTGVPTFDPKRYGIVAESDLEIPLDYIKRDCYAEGTEEVASSLRDDLDTMSAGLVPFSPELKAKMGSKEVLKMLRDAFTGSPDDPLYKALLIRKRDKLGRLQSLSRQWAYKKAETPEVLKPLREWFDIMSKDAINVAQKVDPSIFDPHVNMEIFWVPPGEQAVIGADPRGLHYDQGYVYFGIADQPGLVIKNGNTGKSARVKLVEDAFQFWKGGYFDHGQNLLRENKATYHGVWGPEMAKNGRVSVLLAVS